MNKKFVSGFFLLTGLLIAGAIMTTSCPQPGQFEGQRAGGAVTLKRDVVAVYSATDGVFISWKLNLIDPTNITFNVIRNGNVLLNEKPLGPAYTDLVDKNGTLTSTYQVEVLFGGISQGFSEIVAPWRNPYRQINIVKPDQSKWILTSGRPYIDIFDDELKTMDIAGYNAYDCVPCDLDGNGIMDLVIFWSPRNEKDSSQGGITGQVYIDAYEIPSDAHPNGRRLWSKHIELGPNIRAGNHDQIMCVADFNGDGFGEIIVKTGPLTVDTANRVLGPWTSGGLQTWYRDGDIGGAIHNAPAPFTASTMVIRPTGWAADGSPSGNYPNAIDMDTGTDIFTPIPYHYVNSGGYILAGEEYLTVFNGATGEFIQTIEFPVQRNQLQYGRSGNEIVQGNRTQRFNGGVAKLTTASGALPGKPKLSAIMARGYYGEQALTVSAIDFDGTNLSVKWIFSTEPYTQASLSSGLPVRKQLPPTNATVSGSNITNNHQFSIFPGRVPEYTNANGPYGSSQGLSSAGPYASAAKYGASGAGSIYRNQGNHQLMVADSNFDGLDEIYLGSMAINEDGSVRWSSFRGHGDAMHVGNFNPWLDNDPSAPGGHSGDIYLFGVLEGTTGMQLINARTGVSIWYHSGNGDTGRGMTADVDPDYPGNETWGNSGSGLRASNMEGTRLAGNLSSLNFGIFWGGGVNRFLLDGGDGSDSFVLEPKKLGKGVYGLEEVTRFTRMRSNAGTKQVPMLQADLFGDFREEVIYRNDMSEHLRIFTTTIPTIHSGPQAIPAEGIPTLRDDHQYWMQILCQHSAYNQPPWPSWFIGYNMRPIKWQIANRPQ